MVREQSALCVGPQRRKPYRQLKKPPLCQLPVRSGCPSARRGVGWFCADGSGGGGGPKVGAAGKGLAGGAAAVTAIALWTLAGTGITTYTLPVSVSLVVTSRTTAPFRRSVSLPAYSTSTLLRGLFQSW